MALSLILHISLTVKVNWSYFIRDWWACRGVLFSEETHTLIPVLLLLFPHVYSCMTGMCVTYWLCVVSLYRRPEHKEKKSVRLVVTSVSIALQTTALVDYGEGDLCGIYLFSVVCVSFKGSSTIFGVDVWHLGWVFGILSYGKILVTAIVELFADLSLQAEDSYIEAKQIYDELTDELYDELPSFYDR